MNPSPTTLLRPDLRGFAGYRSARSSMAGGDTWLNANESAWPNPADDDARVRRYPDPQPSALRALMATRYGCRPEQVLVGRGSDEGIDLLVRAFCRPGGDAVVVTPPTFGMYEVCARLHGARVVAVPLVDGERGFACDFDEVGNAALAAGARLVFLCSPGNPVGSRLSLAAIESLALRLRGRALVVVDEAYIEYSEGASAVSLIGRQRNVVVLRTLSKAHALAGARIGCVVADAELVEVLQRCQSPYPVPAPCAELACRALDDAAWSDTLGHIAMTVAERTRMGRAISTLPQVRRVYPSSANFLLVRFADAAAVLERLLGAGIVVRDMRGYPGLGDALRITIGTPDQNDRVIAQLAALEAVA
ncbi:MAG: histidinol-phosphate transaminase [Lysobacter sp.]|uniref:Histidinol-phosphate aminotransferase n=1 Tax=Novilysobacter luteus TaxID=2822368 RepID=A0ABM8UG67_9GAMM|nr:histidinol-phosphate transaminase [Lysobacter luteus]MDV3254785.1 histidinol-phosphate transaminase [Lysobacter sp.]MDV5980780.1 histidinol-phosphate transaminase [Lysobacter sp.]CAG4974229.1 Histidinol-phosphate aminotransferase [Lysobacter luteus]